MTEIREAAAEQARRVDRILGPYVPDATRWEVVRRIVEDFLEQHWRPLPPAPAAQQRKQDPAVAHRGAELARELLGRTTDARD